jgi:hypothetical protein
MIWYKHQNFIKATKNVKGTQGCHGETNEEEREGGKSFKKRRKKRILSRGKWCS